MPTQLSTSTRDPRRSEPPQRALVHGRQIREHGITQPLPVMATRDRDSDPPDGADWRLFPHVDDETELFITFVIAEAIDRHDRMRPFTPDESRSLRDTPRNDNN